jgi:protocatechuate 3,4-dioxygenase beta subunit
VLLYAYNTDDTGVYRREGTETGNGRRHGQLRGWLRTDAAGRYEIRTIYPGGYPGRPDPSHVHITLTPSSGPTAGQEQWADSTVFDDDPRMTPAERAERREDGRFNPIVSLAEDEHGVLVGERDLRLLSPDELRARAASLD